MKMFLKWAAGLAFLAVVVISAVGALPDHLKPAAAVAGPASFDNDGAIRVMLQAEDQVRRILKDPDSAKFGAVSMVAPTNASTKSAAPPKPETGTVCGYVNAKNSFGGYVGTSMFMVFPNLVPFLQPSETNITEYNSFIHLWNRECAGKPTLASL